ncbi:hypothetical protein XENOCAPTIV_013877 [Xenoophorus captivus]|uniref:Uncharacterized protein n=1 Tax=Xenoophorus captivus TaxID=1517983 RepID=A0ABV0RQM9_9TELE
MKLVKDRGRMEQLAAGAAQPLSRFRDLEMEEMVEELQEKVRGLQAENEGLKQRLVVAKQQIINSQSRRQTQYEHVHSRVNCGVKKLRDDSSSPSPGRQRSESKQFAHRLRMCSVQHLQGIIGWIQFNTESVQFRPTTVKCFLGAETTGCLMVFQGKRAMVKVVELTAQLKDERMKNLELDKQLQTANFTKIQVEQVRLPVITSVSLFVRSAFDVSQQKGQLREQQLKLQIVQLETALKADLVDKNEILDRIKSERGLFLSHNVCSAELQAD